MSTAEVSAETIGLRLRAQLLHRPSTGSTCTPVDAVVGHLLAVQAQDLRGARLTIRARTRGLVAADVDRALTVDRSVVVTWANRGTLHLVAVDDLPMLHALTTPQLHVSNARRLDQEGVPTDDADRAVAAVVAHLAEHGPRTRAQLREAVDATGVRTEGQALIHVLFLATLRGLVVRGPMVDGEQAFVLVRDWLGADVAAALADPAGTVDRDVALAELARRYLAAHGPATDRDLVKWVGTTLGDARRGLRAIGHELVERADGTVDLIERPADRSCDDADADPVPAALLGPFDELLMGWASRQPVLGDDASTITSNGIFRPFVLVDGRAVGRWSLPTARSSAIEVEPFDSPTDRAAVASASDALAEDAADVVRFLAASG